MAPHIPTSSSEGCTVLFLLLAISLIVLPITARENGPILTPAPELNITNFSAGADMQPGDFAAGPTPITILHVELNQSTLPGPRDMGYGPSVIDLTIAPPLLAVIFVIILIGLGGWVVLIRRSKTNPDDPGLKK